VRIITEIDSFYSSRFGAIMFSVSFVPRQIEYLELETDEAVAQVACGMAHNVLVTSTSTHSPHL
jgi:hypothetical protein